MLKVLEPPNNIEALSYRRNFNRSRPFLQLTHSDVPWFKLREDVPVAVIGFAHRKHATCRGQTVLITIVKHFQVDYSFWLKTIDGTAVGARDFTPKFELMTMKSSEQER